tara:strand:- start:11 stop:601 length:591 start_codon:yes stop_codon:yes gene_type:complete
MRLADRRHTALDGSRRMQRDDDDVRGQLRLAAEYAALAEALEPGRVRVSILNVPRRVQRLRECRRLVKFAAKATRETKRSRVEGRASPDVFHIRVMPGARASVRVDGARLDVVIPACNHQHRVLCAFTLCLILLVCVYASNRGCPGGARVAGLRDAWTPALHPGAAGGLRPRNLCVSGYPTHPTQTDRTECARRSY